MNCWREGLEKFKFRYPNNEITIVKLFFQIVLFIIIAGIIMVAIGGSADFLASFTRHQLTSFFGLGEYSFWTTLLLVLVFLVAVVLLIPLVLLVRTRFVRPVVFISFKNVHEKKAVELEKQLKKEGFGVERLAFSKKYKHDEVVSQVRKKLQKSHVLVAIPDAEEASFVDAELLAASALKIPIVLLRYQEKQSQPGTLLLGYPVFDFRSIQNQQFAPLFRFLLFATRHRKDFFNQIRRILKQMLDPAILLVLGILVGIFLLIKFGARMLHQLLSKVLDWDVGNFLVEGDDLNQSVLIMLIVGFAAYSIGKAFYTLRVARQVVVTGTDSYKTFKEEFSFLKKDREMMACIQLNVLEAKGKEGFNDSNLSY